MRYASLVRASREVTACSPHSHSVSARLCAAPAFDSALVSAFVCAPSLLSFLHQDTIDRCEIFKNADESFLRSVTTKLKFCVSLPGDFVFKEDEAGDKIYFLRKGRIEISTEEDGPLTLLEEGAYFGEISLVLPPPAAAAAVEKAAAEAAARLPPHRRGSSSIGGLGVGGIGGMASPSAAGTDAPPGTPSAASLSAEYGRRKRSASAKSLINSDMYFLLRDEFLSILSTYTQYQFLFVAIAEQRLKQTKLHRDELLVEKILELHLKKGWLRLAGFKKQVIRAPGAAPAVVNANRMTVSGVSGGAGVNGGLKRTGSPMPSGTPPPATGVRFATTPTPSPPPSSRSPGANTAAGAASSPTAAISSPSGASTAQPLRSPSRLAVPPASLTVDTGATPTPPPATPAVPATAASTESKSLEP